MSADLRGVALLEASKGLVVLAASITLFRNVHARWQLYAESAIRHLHLDPASHYSRLLLSLGSHFTASRVLTLACGALLYAIIRLLEAYGLWRDRHWAVMLGMVSAAIYLPFELFELLTDFNPPTLAVFLVNLLVVAILWRHRH